MSMSLIDVKIQQALDLLESTSDGLLARLLTDKVRPLSVEQADHIYAARGHIALAVHELKGAIAK